MAGYPAENPAGSPAAFAALGTAVGLPGLSGSNIGLRIFGGRIANVKDVSAGRTYESFAATALPFDAVRVILSVGQTGGNDAVTPTVGVGVAPVGDTTDASLTAAAWVTATVASAGTFTMPPAATAARRTLVRTDPIAVASVPRTDGGTLPLIAMRAFVTSAAGNIVILGNGTQSFANWATHPSGRIWRMTSKGGGFAQSTQSGMTVANSTVENGSIIVGIEYLARGRVVNVVGFGDSIVEGQGTYIGEGYGFPACVALTAASAFSGVAYEWSDLGWAGQAMSNFRDNVADAIAGGIKPNVALLPMGSPNEISTTISAANISATRTKAAFARISLSAASIPVILGTWLPTNTAVKNYGATDSLRTAYNAEVRAEATKGSVVADFDAVLAGVTTGGQVQMLSGSTSDNIHPNDTGNALLAPVMANAIKAAVGIPRPGLLVTA